MNKNGKTDNIYSFQSSQQVMYDKKIVILIIKELNTLSLVQTLGKCGQNYSLPLKHMNHKNA